ncbi:MAG: HPP family protein [Acidimicrobiales bacterium]
MPSHPVPPVPTATLKGVGGRSAFAVRLAVLGGVAVCAVGVVDHFSQWPLLTAALGPTAYVLIAHPRSVSARLRNAVLGHSIGVGAGLAALAIFGLWNAPSISLVGHASLRQAGSAGLAIGVTLLLLHALRAHHAPSAATALLIATDQAKVGPPLYGLVVGLAAIVAFAWVLNAIPALRDWRERADDS